MKKPHLRTEPEISAALIRFPKDLHEAMWAMAFKQRRSLTQTVLVACEEYLRQHEDDA